MRSVFLSTTLVASMLFGAEARGQGYEPVESLPGCREGEPLETCRRRLCEPGEDIEDCRERLIEEREERREREREEREDREREREERREDRERERDERREEREDRREDREREREEREERREEARERREERREEREDRRDRRSRGSSRAPDVLRPGTRPMFFAGAIGPTFFGLNRGRFFGRRGGVHARARVALDFGYHFSGDFEGPAIGATIEQAFGDIFYLFNPGFKFWWDIQPVDDYGIYIAPFGKAGYAVTGCSAFYGCPDHAFNLAAGVEGRLVLADRGLVLLRPVQVDTYLGNFFNRTFWINYSFLVGGGVTF